MVKVIGNEPFERARNLYAEVTDYFETGFAEKSESTILKNALPSSPDSITNLASAKWTTIVSVP
jgi:hypothetical protein